MIDVDNWQQKIESQLDKAAFDWEVIDYVGPFADDLRAGGVIKDYYDIVNQMDDDDTDYYHVQFLLDMDACVHELSTMTI